ncbi:MAG TPA: SDR family NAD(P)-dependent oxidoreductase, partial [Polyangiales bacterium]|nr:SDR family NAD(P)-dependent oxidoreductase [Polyangiales bacterium]
MIPNIVLVTGASAGFGEAIVRKFAAAGARVVATARRLERLEKLAGELGERVLPVALDVRSRADVERTLATLPRDFVDVDLLVNNAGLA